VYKFKQFIITYTISGIIVIVIGGIANANKYGVISFDFSTNDYWSIVWRGAGKVLAEAMYNVAKSINDNFLWGRTIGGLNTELQLHFAAYKLGIEKSRSCVADMGSLLKGKLGYDSSAFVWEGVNAGKLVGKIWVYGILGVASAIKDIGRYFD